MWPWPTFPPPQWSIFSPPLTACVAERLRSHPLLRFLSESLPRSPTLTLQATARSRRLLSADAYQLAPRALTLALPTLWRRHGCPPTTEASRTDVTMRISRLILTLQTNSGPWTCTMHANAVVSLSLLQCRFSVVAMSPCRPVGHSEPLVIADDLRRWFTLRPATGTKPAFIPHNRNSPG